MMKTSILVLVGVFVVYSAARSQDIQPTSIADQSIGQPIPLTSLAQIDGSNLPVYIGWNWGPGLRTVNADFHSNILHLSSKWGPALDQRGGASIFQQEHSEMSKTVPGMRLIMAPTRMLAENMVQFQLDSLPWYGNLYTTAPLGQQTFVDFGGTDPFALTEGMGIRYQPEITVSTTSPETTFTPRVGDQQGAVFGFQTKDLTLGTVPAPGSANDSRYVLHQTGAIAATTVLSDCWPNTAISEWEEARTNRLASPFNGRRMFFAINLRRNETTDNTDNADVILRLRIEYEKCDLTTGLVIFDALPDPTGTLRTILPRTLDGTPRGLVANMIDHRTGTAMTEVVITRQMLPHGNATNQAGIVPDPDITIMAHCTFDRLPFENIPGSPPVNANNNEAFLLGNWQANTGCGDDGRRIRKLKIIVDYEGRSDVAIDWVQLGTDNLTRLTQGYYDNHAHRVYRDILLDLANFNAATSRHQTSATALRLYRWFNRDEGDRQYWEGMRYFDRLFNNLTMTERGVAHEYARYHHSVASASDFTWQGATPTYNTNTVVPYYKAGYHGLNIDPAITPHVDPRMYLNNEWGMNTTDISAKIDYDARWGEWTNLQQHPDPLKLPADLTTSHYPGIQNGIVQFGSGSVQQKYECDRYRIMLAPEFLFNPNRPWVANSWLHSNWESESSTGPVGVAAWRVLTAEEARLSISSQIILGSKGLIMYWGASIDSLVDPDNYNKNSTNGGAGKDHGVCGNLVNPNPVINPATGNAWRSEATADLMSAFQNGLTWDDERAGADFLLAKNEPGTANLAYGYRTGLRTAIDGTTNRLAAVTSNLAVHEDSIYVGALSMRKAVKEITDVLWNARDTIKNFSLVRWYSH